MDRKERSRQISNLKTRRIFNAVLLTIMTVLSLILVGNTANQWECISLPDENKKEMILIFAMFCFMLIVTVAGVFLCAIDLAKI